MNSLSEHKQITLEQFGEIILKHKTILDLEFKSLEEEQSDDYICVEDIVGYRYKEKMYRERGRFDNNQFL